MGGALGGAGRGRAHAAAAAPDRRDAIPVGGVGDVAPTGLAGPSPQRLAIPRQAATPLLGHPARLARLRRQRVVAQVAPAPRGSSLRVPSRAAGTAALDGRPGRTRRPVAERPALGHLLDPGALRHPARPFACCSRWCGVADAGSGGRAAAGSPTASEWGLVSSPRDLWYWCTCFRWRCWRRGGRSRLRFGAGAGIAGLVAAFALGTGDRIGVGVARAVHGEVRPTGRRSSGRRAPGRIAHAFAHRRPWWWYLPLLPLVLFPWALWPSLWRSFAELRRGPPQVATRFALSCLVPGLIVFSLISGKQVHYLMPLLPVFAILAGTAIATRPRPISLSLVSPALLIVAHLAAAGPLAWRYDLRPAAAEAKDAERAGRPVAYVGGYEGQLHFLGRLERPLEEVKLADVGRWRAAHPGGLVLFRKTPASSAPPSLPFRPERPAAGD